ncbi:hypothetical protein Tco_0213260 [Tanacetum coccineum]
MDNKLREAINKAILAHNLDCSQEAQTEKNAYIEIVDISIRALIKEEVNTQLPQILPQAVSDFANPVIEKNVIESVEAAVLTRYSSQLTSTYEAAASLSKFKFTKILIDKREKNKSYDKADYKKKLYDALVESYNTDKDLFNSYGKVISLKKIRDEDKDRDPSAGSDRGKKRRKSSKDVESSKDSRSKEKKSSSTSKDAPNLNISLPESLPMQRSQVKYDQHAYLGTSYWGPNCQRFYGYASNLTLSKDVYSRRRIISVTRLKIMKMYDYGHLEEIEFRRDDQKLYTFKEVDQFKSKRLMRADELHKFSDGMLKDVRTALHDIAAGIRMEYLPMRKWSNLDKKRARVMNWRDLPRDIPLDSVVVLRYEKRSKSENKGKVPTEMELVLEQTQQGTSYEVSVSAEGVEELKRKVKIKGEKKEASYKLRQKLGQHILLSKINKMIADMKMTSWTQ